MGQSLNTLHKIPETGSARATMSLSDATTNTYLASRTIPLELLPLIAPYRHRGRFTLRIENLPQSARLSAGRTNGDQTWSLGLDELEELFYFPPVQLSKEHTLAVRLISKDDAEASTIALIDVVVMPGVADNGLQTIPLPVPLSTSQITAKKSTEKELPDKFLQLQTTLAERTAELSQIQVSIAQRDADWERRLEKALYEAEGAWKSSEAVRIEAAKTEVREQFERTLFESEQSARISHERAAAALGQLRQKLAATEDQIARRDAELALLEEKFERAEQERAAELCSIKLAFEATRTAEAERFSATAKALAAANSRCEAAETALAAFGISTPSVNAEIERLLAQLELARAEMDNKVSAARASAAREAEGRLKAAKAQWEQKAAMALAEVETRFKRAEAALASASADTTNPDAYVRGLHSEIKRLQAVLVHREVSAARTVARLEQSRVGAVPDTPASRWRPLSNRPDAELDLPAGNSGAHLVRDVVIIFVVVITAVVLFPQFEAMLPDSMRLKIAALGGPAEQSGKAQAPVTGMPTIQKKAEYPIALVMRGVNVRSRPSTSGTSVTYLKRGARVTVLEKQGKWDRVTVSGIGQNLQQGWVFGSYLEVPDAKASKP